MVKKADIAPDDIASVSPAYWAAFLHKIKLSSGRPYQFEGREYLLESIETTCKEHVSMKATGGGFSEAAILRSLHGMIYGRYKQGVAYYFPTDADMLDYSKSRFSPLITLNPTAIGKFIKNIGTRGYDSAGLKRVGNATLYLRGATLNPTADGDARQSTKVSGIHVDRAVLDEVDQMEYEVIAKIKGRLANAEVDGIKGFSEMDFLANPSDEDRGVDLLWKGSDQRYWFRECECGQKTCAELEFLNDPEKCVGFYPDRTDREKNNQPIGYIRCAKCEKPIGIRRGSWIPQRPEITTRIGHNWSHLTSEYHDPARILRDYRNPPQGNFGDVMRLDLGLAYSAKEDRLRKETVWNCCSNEGIPDGHSGPCAMGVDNDDAKHVVIGFRTGNDRYEIIKPIKVDDFKAAYDLVRRFGVKSCVVDIRPNKDSAREFQRNCLHAGCRVYLCEYTESILQDAVYNDDTGIVKVYRTGIFDESHRVFTENLVVLPRRSAIIDDYALQCCNCVKAKDENKRTKQIVFRYKKTGGGNDHFRNATNYFLVAAKKVGRTKPRRFMNNSEADCQADYAVI